MIKLLATNLIVKPSDNLLGFINSSQIKQSRFKLVKKKIRNRFSFQIKFNANKVFEISFIKFKLQSIKLNPSIYKHPSNCQFVYKLHAC